MKKIIAFLSISLLLVSHLAFAGKKTKGPKQLTHTERQLAKARNLQKKELETLIEQKNTLLTNQAIGNEVKNHFSKSIKLVDLIDQEQQQLALTHATITEKNKTGEIPTKFLKSELNLTPEKKLATIAFCPKGTMNTDSHESTIENIIAKLTQYKLENLNLMNEIQLKKQQQISLGFMQSDDQIIKYYGTFCYHLTTINIYKTQKKKLRNIATPCLQHYLPLHLI